MADPTTILAYATKRRDDAKDAVAAAQQKLVAAQASFGAGNEEAATATKTFAELEAKAAEIRKKLSTVPTPADGAALLAALEETIIRMRGAQGAAQAAQARLSSMRADSDAAQTDLTAVSTRLTVAEAALKQAKLDGKRRDGWVAALGANPLAKTNTDADKALKAKPFTDAKTRVENDIPAKLLARADQRRTAQSARLTVVDDAAQAAAEAAQAEREKNGGLAAKAAVLWSRFLKLEASVGSFVSLAKERFDQAQTLLAQVKDDTRAPLTAEQSARINDAALKASREAAADEEKALDAKLKALEDARAALAAAILAARAANKDPETEKPVTDAKKAVTKAEGDFKTLDDAWRDKERALKAAFAKVEEKRAAVTQAIQKAIAAKKDPNKDADVTKAKNELTKAQTDLETARNDYRASTHGILHAWQAAVPDATWRLLDDYEEATSTLQALKASDPAALATDLQTAEGNYVAAQLAADASSHVSEAIAAEQVQRSAQQKSARQAAAAGLFSALRGDN